MLNLVVALARSTHPGPTLAVTSITVLLGVAVGLEPARLVLLGAAMLANQVSVGLSNDWLDAERDRAVGRFDKPVASGLISVQAARTAAWASVAVSIALTIPLGIGATLTQVAFIASAWAYNAGLKATAFSGAPYIVSFGLLSLIVTQSLPEPAGAAWWAILSGSLLGIAAHFANVLPDLEDDRRTGIRGLPHRLGRKAAGVATYLVLAVASLVLMIGAALPAAVSYIGLGLNLLIAAVGIGLVLSRPPTRLLFQLIIAAAIIDVALLVLSGDRMLV